MMASSSTASAPSLPPPVGEARETKSCSESSSTRAGTKGHSTKSCPRTEPTALVQLRTVARVEGEEARSVDTELRFLKRTHHSVLRQLEIKFGALLGRAPEKPYWFRIYTGGPECSRNAACGLSQVTGGIALVQGEHRDQGKMPEGSTMLGGCAHSIPALMQAVCSSSHRCVITLEEKADGAGFPSPGGGEGDDAQPGDSAAQDTCAGAATAPVPVCGDCQRAASWPRGHLRVTLLHSCGSPVCDFQLHHYLRTDRDILMSLEKKIQAILCRPLHPSFTIQVQTLSGWLNLRICEHSVRRMLEVGALNKQKVVIRVRHPVGSQAANEDSEDKLHDQQEVECSLCEREESLAFHSASCTTACARRHVSNLKVSSAAGCSASCLSLVLRNAIGSGQLTRPSSVVLPANADPAKAIANLRSLVEDWSAPAGAESFRQALLLLLASSKLTAGCVRLTRETPFDVPLQQLWNVVDKASSCQEVVEELVTTGLALRIAVAFVVAWPTAVTMLKEAFQPQKSGFRRARPAAGERPPSSASLSGGDRRGEGGVDGVAAPNPRPVSSEDRPHQGEREVHRGIVCDRCDRVPIVGERYHCRDCPDFDLCGNCHRFTTHDAGHTFERKVSPIKVPVDGDRDWLSAMYEKERSPLRFRAVDLPPAIMRHRNVVCDGCEMFPLVGRRFQCVNCPNFDLCERCIITTEHDPEHEFRQISGVRAGQTRDGDNASVGNQRTREDARAGTALYSASIPAESRTNVGSAPPHAVHRYVACDGCQAFPLVGSRFKCVVCEDFDLCEMCEARDHEHTSRHPFLKLRAPTEVSVSASGSCAATSQSSVQTQAVDRRPGSTQTETKEKKDVTTETSEEKETCHQSSGAESEPSEIKNENKDEETQGPAPTLSPQAERQPLTDLDVGREGDAPSELTVEPDTIMRHQWVLKNSGRLPWPAETCLVQSKPLTEAVGAVHVGFVASGETAVVEVEMRTPSRGSKELEWRLQGSGGEAIGAPFKMELRVNPDLGRSMDMSHVGLAMRNASDMAEQEDRHGVVTKAGECKVPDGDSTKTTKGANDKETRIIDSDKKTGQEEEPCELRAVEHPGEGSLLITYSAPTSESSGQTTPLSDCSLIEGWGALEEDHVSNAANLGSRSFDELSDCSSDSWCDVEDEDTSLDSQGTDAVGAASQVMTLSVCSEDEKEWDSVIAADSPPSPSNERADESKEEESNPDTSQQVAFTPHVVNDDKVDGTDFVEVEQQNLFVGTVEGEVFVESSVGFKSSHDFSHNSEARSNDASSDAGVEFKDGQVIEVTEAFQNRAQLDRLVEMGFADQEKNEEALRACGGSVEDAVGQLLKEQ